MSKDAPESGHQIHLTRAQAEEYLRKRVSQFLRGERSKLSLNLARDVFMDTYYEGQTELQTLQEIRRRNTNPWADKP